MVSQSLKQEQPISLQPEYVLNHVKANSKKRALQYAAELISQDADHIDGELVFEQLIAREKLGSTGLGNGIAIPHCRCEFIQQARTALLTLEQAIDFDAVDGNPVDIIFVVVVPADANEQHLATLANLAKLLEIAEYRNKLRKASSNSELFEQALAFI